jgi:CubicO group peptidase (beta-lactamase class C family)
VVNRILGEPRRTGAGGQWIYSGPAYAVLGRIIEIASGELFETFVTKKILAPLGMRDTTFHPAGQFRRRLASLYQLEHGRI